jgi:hypothetical protein
MVNYLTLTGAGPWGSVSTVSESEELGGLAFFFWNFNDLLTLNSSVFLLIALLFLLEHTAIYKCVYLGKKCRFLNQQMITL